MKKRFWRNSMLMLLVVIGLCGHALAATNASITISSTGTPVSSPGTITVAFSDSAGHNYSESVPYGPYSTPASLAAWLGAKFTSSYVCASAGSCTGGLGARVITPGSGTVTFQLNNGASFGWPTITNSSGSFSFSLSNWPASTPVISWPAPAAITYGTALSATQLDASASVAGTSVAGTSVPVAGTFSYSPASGTVLTAGNQTLTVTFIPTNTTLFSTGSAAVALTVNKATPAITWPAPANVIPGTALSSVQLDATASVPGTFAYSPTAGTVMAAGFQTLSLTFTPADTTDYNTATATVTLTGSLAPSAGIITTVAGNGTEGYTGDGGLATNYELNRPSSIGVDASGNIYIADTYNQRVRKVAASTGDITTVAGTGTAGNLNDTGSAIDAQLYYPETIAVDASGDIYIGDLEYNRILKVTAAGSISTVAGNGTAGTSCGSGSATNAEITPFGVSVDALGNFYFTDSIELNGANGSYFTYAFCKVNAAGNITTVSGVGAGGPVDSAGNIYFVSGNNINKLSASTGNISTVAGNGTAGDTGDGGQATSAEIQASNGFDVDAAGNIYILSSEGSVSTIRKVTASTGIVDTVIGGVSGCSQQSDNVGDGCPAADGILTTPYGVTADSNGNIYVSDYWGQRIRAVGATITPTVNVSCSPNPITFGGPNSQCDVSVGSGATGSVTLTYNGTTWTTLTLSSGTATATWPSTTGGGTFLIVATYTGDAAHSSAVGSASLIVTQLASTIVWPSPAPILYGTQLNATQLDAVANVPGSYAYSPALGTTPPLGVDTLMVTFTPQSSGYSVVTAITPLIVNSVVTTLPTITSILPDPAAVGASVTIVGDLFGTSQGSSTVTFNGVAATTVTSWANNAIVATVPVGAKTGPVVVNAGGTASNGFLLMVPVPCGP